MNSRVWIAAAAIAACSLPAAANEDLLARMAALNPGLHAYTASIHADVHLKTFPFVSATLEGTLYHKDPDKNKLVISSGMPAMEQQFDKLYAEIPAPSQWTSLFDVKKTGDDGKTSAFTLTPKKKGNVDGIDAQVDDAAATVVYMRWNYGNGGYAELTNKYKQVKGNTVAGWQNAHIQEPGYTADISSTLDNYKFNPDISDDFFSQ